MGAPHAYRRAVETDLGRTPARRQARALQDIQTIMNDTLQRFLLESTPVRGEIAHLDATWRAVLERRSYPAALERLLGEMMAAAALLSATLKFEGSLIMQMQGSGPVQLLVVEATSEQTLRATAKWDGELSNGNVNELL